MPYTHVGICFLSSALLGAAPTLEAQSAKDVIEKAIAAHGGREKLTKHKGTAIKAVGTFYLGDDPMSFTMEAKEMFAGKERQDITLNLMDMTFHMIIVINGEKGWRSMNGNTEDIPEEEMASIRDNLHLQKATKLYPLLDKEYTLKLLKPAKVGKHECFVVSVSHKKNKEVKLFFDKKSLLLIQSQMSVKDPLAGKEVMQETLYENYKEVEGMQMPHKETVTRDGKKYLESEVSELKLLEKIDDREFEKP